MKKTSLFLSLAVVLAFNSLSFATVLLTDNFSYTNGNLITGGDVVGATGWGDWTVHNTTAGYERIQVNNGTIVLNQLAGKEDVSKLFGGVTMQTGDTFFAAFDVNVTDLASNGTGDVYFAHFIKTGSTTFVSRVGVTASTSGGDYTFALFTGPTTGLGGFNYGTKYRVVTSYDFSSGVSKLWVNPANYSDTSIQITSSTGIAVSAFAFRQNGNIATSSGQTIDNLIVGTTFAEVVPEPATLLLPNGGEKWVAGTKHTIEWDTSDPNIITHVSIKYSADNGQTWYDVVICENTGSYEWDPVPAVDSNQCLIRISDSVNPNHYDKSDDVFTIFQCSNPITGDLNDDCYVNFLDFAVIADHWLNCGNPFDPSCQP